LKRLSGSTEVAVALSETVALLVVIVSLVRLQILYEFQFFKSFLYEFKFSFFYNHFSISTVSVFKFFRVVV